MKAMTRILAVVSLAGAFGPAPRAVGQEAGQVDFFERKIRPVLIEHCYRCHSAESAKAGKLKGGLQLDSRDGIRAGGDSGPAVVPGSVAKSVLIAAIRHQKLEMPPQGKLPEAIIADFVRWVEQGAIDPRDGMTSTRAARIDIEKGRTFWAFQPPRIHPRPHVKRTEWPRKELDWFVLAAQESRGIDLVRPASKHEWIRRATLDLIGLPPAPEEIDAFENDTSVDARARVIDRLLSSPHYGERWGRYWLDLARYTDDLGGTVGPVQAPNAYRYRDWVVQAFNRDMPYDQFIRLQLAGDLIPEPAADYEERLVGLGFQGLGQRFSGNAVGMVKMKVADELDDRVDTVSRSLLGLTVSCARCHDHKFDPIPTADYYSFAAAYNGASLSIERMIASPRAIAAHEQWLKDVPERTKKLDEITQSVGNQLGRAELRNIERYLLSAWKVRVLAQRKVAVDVAETAQRDHLNPLFLTRWVKALAAGKPLPLMTEWQAAADMATKEVLAIAGDIRTPALLAEQTAKLAKQILVAAQDLERLEESRGNLSLLAAERQTILKVFLLNDGAVFKVNGKDAIPYLTADQKARYDELSAEVQQLKNAAPPVPSKSPSVSGGGQAMQINIRGNPEQLGQVAPPGFLQILRPAGSPPEGSFTRLELAGAIASRENPLTARVWVNRVWHYHFGRGIVGTLGNFGHLGDRPTHPELLDTLAVRFMESGWSTRWLHREIMLSAAYGLSCGGDPRNADKDADNLTLWRTSPRRLDFEAWRDSMLAVSGMLDARIGGPPKDKGELHPEDPMNNRRTVYCFISRFKPNPTLTLFDFPEPNVTSERRNVTTIPQQQLFALNGPFIVAAAKAFSARIEKEEPNEDARIRLAWRLAFGRLPTVREVQLSRAFLRQEVDPAAQLSPWQQLCHSLLTTNEFGFVN